MGLRPSAGVILVAVRIHAVAAVVAGRRSLRAVRRAVPAVAESKSESYDDFPEALDEEDDDLPF